MKTVRTLRSTSDLSYASVGFVAAYAKAINGGLVATIGALSVSISDKSVTGWEVAIVALTGVAAFFAVLSRSNEFDPLDVQPDGSVTPAAAPAPTVLPAPAPTVDLTAFEPGNHTST